MKYCDSTQAESASTVNELKKAYFTLELNKSPGYDVIRFNVVSNFFDSLRKPLMAISCLYLQKIYFPEKN